MANHFHALTVKEVRKLTKDCVELTFNVPLPLKAVFQFTQGQYITLRKNIKGIELRRSYSICSSTLDDELMIAIKKMHGGVFSTYANEHIKKGDVIDVLPPMGNFYSALNGEEAKKYVAFAAGSGITPILSIIKTTLALEPKSSFTLIYGNRNIRSIIFKEELEGLKNKYMGRFSIMHILSREKTDTPIHFGRINGEKCRLLSQKYDDFLQADNFFLCGPAEMIFSLQLELKKIGVNEKKIHLELFSSSSPNKMILPTNLEEIKHQAMSRVTIQSDGISIDFNLAYSGDSILDAALEQGLDLPFACKGGVCCTCKAKLIEGKVKMDVHYGLEPDEIAEGFILTCQSHPQSENVVVSFDKK